MYLLRYISLKKCINLLICFTWRQITIMFIKSQWNTGTTFRYIMDFQFIISEHFVAVLMYLLKYSSLQKCINLLINFIQRQSTGTSHQWDGAGEGGAGPLFCAAKNFLKFTYQILKKKNMERSHFLQSQDFLDESCSHFQRRCYVPGV